MWRSGGFLSHRGFITVRSIPLGFQLFLAPLLALALCAGLLMYLYIELHEVYLENESMRQKAVLISESRMLTRGVNEMLDVLDEIEEAEADDDPIDDLMFRYLDEYRLFTDALNQPVLQSALLEEQREKLAEYSKAMEYTEPLDSAKIRAGAEDLLPWLEGAQERFFSVKRQSYLAYYRKVDSITEGLKDLILQVLIGGAFLVLLVSGWTIWAMRRRLQGLTDEMGVFCAVDESAMRGDKLSRLQRCLQMARLRLPEIGAQAKLLQGIEEDRRRLAMDVHDVTLSDVTAILRQVRDIESSLEGEAKTRLQGIEKELMQLLDNLRGVVEDLYPRALDMLGFEAAVEAFVQKKRKSAPGMDLQLLFECSPGDEMNEFEKLNLFRIAQEAIANAIKHSKASLVEITFRCTNGQVSLTVEDNGVGATLPLEPSASAYGVSNIRQRARALNASLNFTESRFSSGLRLEVILPGKQS